MHHFPTLFQINGNSTCGHAFCLMGTMFDPCPREFVVFLVCLFLCLFCFDLLSLFGFSLVGWLVVFCLFFNLIDYHSFSIVKEKKAAIFKRPQKQMKSKHARQEGKRADFESNTNKPL